MGLPQPPDEITSAKTDEQELNYEWWLARGRHSSSTSTRRVIIMGRYARVASVGELAPGQSKLVEVEGKSIALFNVGGAYYALDNTCTHRGGPLAEGALDGDQVTCPWHGAVFNV